MASLTLEQARSIIDGALAEARARGFQPMGVVVLDEGGQFKAGAREDGASEMRIDIAQGKASASIGMGVDSRVLAQRAKDLPTFFASIASVARQPFVPQTGALLVRNADGRIVGAVGASGGTGDEDEHIVRAGIAQAGLRSSAAA